MIFKYRNHSDYKIVILICVLFMLELGCRSAFAACNEGLVGYWPLAETAANSCSGGQDACDKSGNGNHLVWTNTPVIQSDVPTLDSGHTRALQFQDGSDENDFASVSSAADLEGFTEFTISAWINPQAGASDFWSRIASKSNAGTGDDYALLYTDTNAGCNNTPTADGSNINFRANFSVSGQLQLCSDAALASSSGWHHIAATWDGSTMRLYINGTVEDDTLATTGTLQDSNAGFSIGRHADSATDRFYTGYISEVRIYDRALSDTEILNLANGEHCAGPRRRKIIVN